MNTTASSMDPEERKARAFVVNLCTSTTPVALFVPEGEPFAAYEFFVTRRSEEGRERFRLHMGYFSSLSAARDKVEDLRDRYPTAWAGPAPRDTATPEPPRSDDTLAGLSNVRQVLAALDAGGPTAAEALLSSAQELALLETGRLPEPHFAVQIVASDRPIDLSAQPQPALFDVYTLYHVEGTRDGRRWFGLRLGFFNDVDAAKRVACYLKQDFASVVVVPVTVKERERATGEPCAESLTAPDPFRPEPSLLPVRVGPTVESATRKAEPFELLPLAPREPSAPAAPSAAPGAAAIAKPSDTTDSPARRPGGKRAMPPRGTEPGWAAPDAVALDRLGASELDVADDRCAARKHDEVVKGPAASATRGVLGLGKWFGRRSA